ncbi:trehalose-phosphatase [Usitatibacter palustris]|uniref:Trehalose 6-phosphate phosphatase n=1 Tax=Usitatibacter palustris TaxID=2732487 RepID=A0A6M4H3A1_9PROT|nr:trehalose-phosphatase [Usitatibacter palustris]QJR14071.1 Trehalose-6-phosphate phosphatase [Usitatibacter palustris]
MTVPDPQPGWALFLDVDGTLVDLAGHPAAVRVEPGLRGLLENLRDATGGALALVSGRSIADLDRLFAPLELPAAGQHGAEVRTGRVAALPAGPRRAAFDHVAAALDAVVHANPGFVLEDKGSNFALHYRDRPGHAADAEAAIKRAAHELGDDYEVISGHYVYEAKPAAHNKGTAVLQLMREAPFAGRIPVFVGDDRTDEDGFEAVARLGGHSVKIGDGPTRARWRVPDAQAARHWLEDYARRFAHAAGAS